MWRRGPGVTDLLILGNVALFIFLFVQIPRLTRVRLVFQPRVRPVFPRARWLRRQTPGGSC